MAGHPLFPYEPHPDDDPGAEDPRDIGWIRIARRGPRGDLEWVPKSFRADEIGDLDEVFERYGGGVYSFIARNERNALITARMNDVHLPGPSKPLYDEPAAPQAAAVALPVAPATSGGMLGQVAAFAAAVGPMLGPIFGYLSEGRREHQALMLSLLTRSREDQDGAAKAAIEAASANQRVMADFFSKMPQHGGGSATFEQILQAMQLGQQMSGKGAGEDDLLESLVAMFGPALAQQMQQQGQGSATEGPMLPGPEDDRIEVHE